MLYEATAVNAAVIVAIINLDLESLIEWADDNLTTFEPEKTTCTIISNKKVPFDLCERSSGIKMGGVFVEQVDEVKLVGYLFDSKLKFGAMVDKLARKGPTRVAALRRLKPMLNSDNLKLMYTMFVRSILEYGSLACMGAAKSHLQKLDRVQNSAQKIGGFTVESLQSRREAAAIAFALGLLSGDGYGELKQYTPQLFAPLQIGRKRTRAGSTTTVRIKSNVKSPSLDVYRNSFLGSIHKIWCRLPDSLIIEGETKGWNRIKKRAKDFLTGKWQPSTTTEPRVEKASKKAQNSYSTGLNNELNAQTDWEAVRRDMKERGISICVTRVDNKSRNESKQETPPPLLINRDC